jgi:glycosyltransferase involved in cell wall biosynthesis
MESSQITIEATNPPLISIIIVFYNMPREAPRTLFTLTPSYQKFDEKLYEVLVMDNGSSPQLDEEMVCSMSNNFRYYFINKKHPSPASALNEGARLANGKLLGFMIDGARMLSPGILHYVYLGYQTFKNPLITTLGFHLGTKIQFKAVLEGYNQKVEDDLLDSIDWENNGYELFKISCFAGSSRFGWFGPLGESSCLFLKTTLFNDIDGFEEAFDMPGGGLVNLDFYARTSLRPDIELVQILGEGTFHQFHGGAMTGKLEEQRKEEFNKLHAQYFEIRGKPFKIPLKRSHYIGHIPVSAHESLKNSVEGIQQFRMESPEEVQNYEKDEVPSDLLQSRAKKQRVLIILGMHRSGTSMLAGSLRQIGLSLGNINTKAPHNLKGNMEHPAIMHMQEHLLNSNGGSWDNPPDEIMWKKLHLSVRDLFISSFKDENVWGFKDPRTLFTLDGWLKVLPNAEFVGIFRNPSSVVDSLQKRNDFTIEKSLELWKTYNERLLQLHNIYNFPIIEFHQNTSLLTNKLNELVQILNLPSRHSKLSFFKESLRSNEPMQFTIPDEINNLYTALKNRAI